MTDDAERKRWERQKREDRQVKVIAGIVVAVLLALAVGLGLLSQLYAPCWLFSLKDAPVRCVR